MYNAAHSMQQVSFSLLRWLLLWARVWMWVYLYMNSNPFIAMKPGITQNSLQWSRNWVTPEFTNDAFSDRPSLMQILEFDKLLSEYPIRKSTLLFLLLYAAAICRGALLQLSCRIVFQCRNLFKNSLIVHGKSTTGNGQVEFADVDWLRTCGVIVKLESAKIVFVVMHL